MSVDEELLALIGKPVSLRDLLDLVSTTFLLYPLDVLESLLDIGVNPFDHLDCIMTVTIEETNGVVGHVFTFTEGEQVLLRCCEGEYLDDRLVLRRLGGEAR